MAAQNKNTLDRARPSILRPGPQPGSSTGCLTLPGASPSTPGPALFYVTASPLGGLWRPGPGERTIRPKGSNPEPIGVRQPRAVDSCAHQDPPDTVPFAAGPWSLSAAAIAACPKDRPPSLQGTWRCKSTSNPAEAKDSTVRRSRMRF